MSARWSPARDHRPEVASRRPGREHRQPDADQRCRRARRRDHPSMRQPQREIAGCARTPAGVTPGNAHPNSGRAPACRATARRTTPPPTVAGWRGCGKPPPRPSPACGGGGSEGLRRRLHSPAVQEPSPASGGGQGGGCSALHRTRSANVIAPSGRPAASTTGSRSARRAAHRRQRVAQRGVARRCGSPSAVSPRRSRSATVRSASSLRPRASPPTNSATKALAGRSRISSGRAPLREAAAIHARR